MDFSKQLLDIHALFFLVVLHLCWQRGLVDALFHLEVVGVIDAFVGLQPHLDITPPGALRDLVQQQVGLHVVIIREVVGLRDEFLHIVVQGLVRPESVFFGEEVEEELAQPTVVEKGEAGPFEIEEMQLAVQPPIHEFARLVMAVDIKELVVDEERDDVIHIAFVYNFIDGPYSQIDLSEVILVRSFIQGPPIEELIEPSFEHPGDWGTIHLLFQGFNRLVRLRLVKYMPFRRKLDHICNADFIAFSLQPELPCWIPNILVPKFLKVQLRGSSLLDGRLDEIQPNFETRSHIFRFSIF